GDSWPGPAGEWPHAAGPGGTQTCRAPGRPARTGGSWSGPGGPVRWPRRICSDRRVVQPGERSAASRAARSWFILAKGSAGAGIGSGSVLVPTLNMVETEGRECERPDAGFFLPSSFDTAVPGGYATTTRYSILAVPRWRCIVNDCFACPACRQTLRIPASA